MLGKVGEDKRGAGVRRDFAVPNLRDVLPDAIILLGGRGTRIQGLYSDRPKCLVPVAGRPFLLWQLEWLRDSGVRHIHLAAGHMADVLQDWITGYAPSDVEITISVEPDPRGTGGAVKFAEPWIWSDPFFVLNGDSLTPALDLKALVNAHSRVNSQLVSIGVSLIEKTGRYGSVEFDAGNRITAFREKAERDQGWINTGVYCICRQSLALIEDGRNVSIETDIFPELASAGRLQAFPVPSPLFDMGTPDGLQEMAVWLDKQVCRRV